MMALRDWLAEQWRFASVVLAAVLIKFLIDTEPPPDEETKTARAYRVRRQVGGIAAGLFCGYTLTDWLIARLDILQASDRLVIGIVIALMGEHIFRHVAQKAPQIMKWLVDRVTGGRS